MTPEAIAMNQAIKAARKAWDAAQRKAEKAPTDENRAAASAARAAFLALPRPVLASGFHSRDNTAAGRSGRRQHAEQAARTAAAMARCFR